MVGLRPVRRNDTPSYDIFVADALENGAGYSSEIGRATSFGQLLTKTREELTADGAKGDSVDVDRWLARGRILVQGFVASNANGLTTHEINGITVVLNSRTGTAVAFGHPLWRRESYLLTDLQRTTDQCAKELFTASTVLWSDPYELDRTPLAVLRRLNQ